MSLAVGPIHVIRAGLESGAQAETEGVITSIDKEGFYLQDPDEGASTGRRAIYVFTEKKPPADLAVGARVRVRGEYSEFLDPRAVADGFARPQLQVALEDVEVLETGLPLPAPISFHGEPGEVELSREFLEEHALELFAFDLTVVHPANRYGDFYGVPGTIPPGTEGLNERGGLTARAALTPVGVKLPRKDGRLNVGAQLEVEGPMVFRYYGFQVRASPVYDVRPAAKVEPPVTCLEGSEHALSIAVYNLENLDPVRERADRVSDPRNVDDDLASGKYAKLAEQVCWSLKLPDVIAVQEVQDNDGAEVSDETDASKTAQPAIDYIFEASGIVYRYVDVPPAPNTSGGMHGGNIRCGYFYRADRVQLVDGSMRPIGEGEEAFKDCRLPLDARFAFAHGDRVEEVELFNLHKSSQRVHVTPDGKVVDRTQDRIRQGEVTKQAALEAVLLRPESAVLQVGDFNAEAEDPSVLVHGGDGFVAVVDTEGGGPDYSHYFGGRAGRLDHGYAYVPPGVTLRAQTMHVNADFADSEDSPHNSDHDPRVYLLDFSGLVGT